MGQHVHTAVAIKHETSMPPKGVFTPGKSNVFLSTGIWAHFQSSDASGEFDLNLFHSVPSPLLAIITPHLPCGSES